MARPRRRSQSIAWCTVRVNEDCHVIPVRKTRHGYNPIKITRKHLLGHRTECDGHCWCKPSRTYRTDGSRMWIHSDMPS